MAFKELENELSALIIDLNSVTEVPIDTVLFESITFDFSEQDNTKWMKLISEYLIKAKNFEIHCWNEEIEWIELALHYGKLKDSDWKYGKIITGIVTPQFIQMILHLSKPTDVELDNKMTPFFNVFLDDDFQSCHYGTEIYYNESNGKSGKI